MCKYYRQPKPKDGAIFTPVCSHVLVAHCMCVPEYQDECPFFCESKEDEGDHAVAHQPFHGWD